MPDVSGFIQSYTAGMRDAIAFAWNGKHAAEFQDRNQEFRWMVVKECVANPAASPPQLLADLFIADAEWSKQAWCSPLHFAALGAALLERGDPMSVLAFARGFRTSFDTFGACHSMVVSLDALLQAKSQAQALLSTASEPEDKQLLESALELFAKLEAGTACQGWATAGPGTPVSNVRVVWPRWYHKLWQRLKRAFV
jgi:hypothetical protein